MSTRRIRAIAWAAFWILAGCQQRVAADKKELTPLMNAAAQKDLPRVRRLIEQGASVNERTDRGETPLYEAIERQPPNNHSDNLPVVRELLNAGVNPNEVEIFSMNALLVSLTRDYANSDVTLLLLTAGAKPAQKCATGDSEISLATQNLDVEVVRSLIAHKAAINCQDQHGVTALYWAALNGHAGLVALLLQSGADRALQDLAGHTPFDVANTTSADANIQAQFARVRALLR
jgi:ankyrin repeat protein